MSQNNPTGKSVSRELHLSSPASAFAEVEPSTCEVCFTPRTDIISAAAEVRKVPIPYLERQLVLKPGFAC